MSEHPNCYGMSEFFDSVDELVHRECAALCVGCPVFQQCQRTAEDLVAKGMLIEGTWAGRLYGKKPPTHRSTCGRVTGWYHHAKVNEEPCDDCLEAKRMYERNRMRRKRVAAAS